MDRYKPTYQPADAHLPYTMGLLYGDEMDTDMVKTHREYDKPGCPMPIHSHLFLEVAYLRSGPAIDYLIGANTYRVEPGDVLLIPPEVLHGPVLPEEGMEDSVRDVIWVSNHFLSRLSQMWSNRGFFAREDFRVFRVASTRWEEIGVLFENGIREMQSRRFGWEPAVVGNTMVLLSLLGRALVDESILVLKKDPVQLVYRILDYIEIHLEEKITMESVAEEFDISKSGLSQLFRKKLDISFYAYLTKRRLAVAKGLIARQVPMEQVGKQVGFKEHSAFYRAFKKEFGISPREYRTLCQEAENEKLRK